MSTAQNFYEAYKALPKKVQQEVKKLIENENEEKVPLLAQIEEGLKDVKGIQEGKKSKRNIRDLLVELKQVRNA
ncbi:MAG: hypothetical protein U0X91_32635 [Spirosomataceae bacterium]